MDYNRLIKTNIPPELKKLLENPYKNTPTLQEAIKISEQHKIDLHPKYLFYWNELSSTDLITFLEFIKTHLSTQKQLEFPITEIKRQFEILGIEHKIQNNKIILNELNSQILLANIGTTDKNQIEKIILYAKNNLTLTPVQILNKYNKIGIRDKGGTYIGTRMGRPEKAKMRKKFNDETRSQALFPVGEPNNQNKNLKEIFDNETTINENFRTFYCKKCNRETILPTCEICHKKTEQLTFKTYKNQTYFKKQEINTKSYKAELKKILNDDYDKIKLVKGITKTINKHHTTEHPVKGFLRAKNNLYVNKDGTIRYDMIEMGITHFRPSEIGTSITKLKELGYTHDCKNQELKDENQLMEIFPQDVILPDCLETGNETASSYIINTGNYIDELLQKFYKLDKFYNFKTKEDTIGHLIIGLAPHTSAGIVGRIIGYSKTQGCFSHPIWHAAQRRNLDGDENGIILLLDGLINFSREYLPDRRGTRTMDVSLVLTSHLYLDQIDDEVHGMDIANHYPLELYKAAKKYKFPKEIKIEQINQKLNEDDLDKKYLNYSFTHDIENFNDTNVCSAYKNLPTMQDKLNIQLEIANKIRAVDKNKVATYIIEKHFMKDIKGNLRKFSTQNFRCTNCNQIYRRPPLSGICSKCGNPNINFTVHEGSIKKYLQPSYDIIKKYNIDPYIVEVIKLTDIRIKGIFGQDENPQN